MAHKSLIGGTSYNITGGTSLVGGTSHKISHGKTLIDGTEYKISFQEPAYALLYTDNSMSFQYGNSVESGKTVRNIYTGFVNRDYTSIGIPWNSRVNYIQTVVFKNNFSTTTLSNWFRGCEKLSSYNIGGLDINNIQNMAHTYAYCYNLTGSPVCYDNVTNMAYTYYNCRNLTGSPVCGNNVTDMDRTYYNCNKLTGSPVCGDNVTNMSYTYINCRNLTGSPVCGDNVQYMVNTYYNCSNLTGSPVCGNNVTSMVNTYYNCPNLRGNAYIYSSKVSNITNCFRGKSKSKMLNIYLPTGSTTNTTAHQTDYRSMVGANITWTTNSVCSYNTGYNIYIYPVSDVANARTANGD